MSAHLCEVAFWIVGALLCLVPTADGLRQDKFLTPIETAAGRRDWTSQRRLLIGLWLGGLVMSLLGLAKLIVS